MYSSRASNDRFTVALVMAMGLHAVVLLALGFAFEINPLRKAAETLDVVLVNWRSEQAPDEADFLAQAAQQGGGESEDAERPTRESASALPTEGESEVPMQVEAAPPPENQDRMQEVLSERPEARPVQQVTRVEQPPQAQPTAAELMQQSLQMPDLESVSQRPRPFQSRLPRRKFISANTREYEFASYMQAWVAKVERVGNLNYPMEVRRRKLVGNLLMTVGIHADGSVESIEVRRSSGMPELDEAAVRIVRLAAPYAPLPDNIREQVDVLHITRTWKFSSGYTLE
ncbi:MAG: energy transducer TonB [Xanthomonadales bacterium]|nr:energy transducer TonB [Xanthomonadales bacterium]